MGQRLHENLSAAKLVLSDKGAAEVQDRGGREHDTGRALPTALGSLADKSLGCDRPGTLRQAYSVSRLYGLSSSRAPGGGYEPVSWWHGTQKKLRLLQCGLFPRPIFFGWSPANARTGFCSCHISAVSHLPHSVRMRRLSGSAPCMNCQSGSSACRGSFDSF